MKKFFVTIFLISITSTAFSQEYNELLSKKVSLEKPSYIIGDLLIHINNIPDINVVYNGNDKVLDTTIEIPVGTYTLKEILTRICKTVPYEFLRKNGHVIFKKKNLLETYEIKGKIIDKKTNNSLEGANMYIPDVNQGSSSNLKGEFSFILTPGKYTIVCSYIGYTTEKIDINLYDNKVIDIYLNPTNQNLQEVKTFANRSYYADLDKGRTIQIIPPKEIEKVVSNNASDLLHARLKGVWATKTSGAPGDHQRIRIRGINSIFGNVDPLYVVDGVPVPNVNLNSLGIADLNVRDIETVTVLKDASSNVLYGFQGVNGVILIDTKRGGEKKIEFQTIQGFQWLNTRYPLMHTKDFLGTYMLSDSLLNTTYYKNKFPIWARYPVYNDTVHDNTDMQDLLFTHGQSQEYQLNVQGNVLGINYYISGNYLQHKGVVKNTQYNRYTFTCNFDRKIGKKLNFNFLYRTSYQENKNNIENYLGNTDIFQTLRIEPGYYTTPDTFLTKGARFHYPYNLLGYPVDPKSAYMKTVG